MADLTVTVRVSRWRLRLALLLTAAISAGAMLLGIPGSVWIHLRPVQRRGALWILPRVRLTEPPRDGIRILWAPA